MKFSPVKLHWIPSLNRSISNPISLYMGAGVSCVCWESRKLRLVWSTSSTCTSFCQSCVKGYSTTTSVYKDIQGSFHNVSMHGSFSSLSPVNNSQQIHSAAVVVFPFNNLMQHAHIQVVTEHCCGSCFHIANTEHSRHRRLGAAKKRTMLAIFPKISAFENVHQIVFKAHEYKMIFTMYIICIYIYVCVLCLCVCVLWSKHGTSICDIVIHCTMEYIYICICICICICMYTRCNIHIHTIYIYNLHTHVHILYYHIHMQVHLHLQIHIYIFKHIYIYIYEYTFHLPAYNIHVHLEKNT